jgi:tetratricopeptide (TPR) repeat protein
MRTAFLAGTVLGLWLTASAPLRAGVYFPTMPPAPPPTHPGPVTFQLKQLRGCDDARQNPDYPAEPGSMRLTLDQTARTLESRLERGDLSVLERIDLGACYIRLGRYEKARRHLRQTLKDMTPDDPARFLALHNLASAYALDPVAIPRVRATNLREAVNLQRQALDAWQPLEAWPKGWPRWNRDMWVWYRRAERLQLAYYELRMSQTPLGEAVPARPAAAGWRWWKPSGVNVLAGGLFPGFRFVGPEGRYEAGTLSQKMWDRLPPDALPLAVQLLLWAPGDGDLLWLYAEVLNARGDVDFAFDILSEMTGNGPLALSWGGGLAPADVEQHRLILQPVAARVKEERAKTNEIVLPPEQPEQKPDPEPAAAPARPWLPDWRPLAVGFGVGALVTLLVGAQWRQWRRRPVPPPAPAEPSANAAPPDPTGIRPSV